MDSHETARPVYSNTQSEPKFNPRDDAPTSTRLHCLLLNVLQQRTRLADPDTVPIDPASGFLSRSKYNRHSPEVRHVGLRHHPHLHYIVVGVSCASHDDEDGYKSFRLRGIAFLKHEGERDDFWTVEYAYEAQIMLEWDVCLADADSRDAVRFSVGLGWRGMLELFERYGRVQCNRAGELRDGVAAEREDGVLAPLFPEMSGLSRVRLSPLIGSGDD